MKRMLSGIQPSGRLHIGNYIGALAVWVENQAEYENYFCIADLHALTVPERVTSKKLRRQSREVAALYIACGIDPKKSVTFLQSAVPAHTDLAWILTCCTPLGWLRRMTQFKAKTGNSDAVGTGLLTYPALQAADILLYQPDFVPVGEDQKQHVEITREIGRRFNVLFGGNLRLPDPMIRASGARIMAFDDPTSKMSKSLAETSPGHAIGLLDPPESIRKAIMSAKTDSGREVRCDNPSPGIGNLLTVYEVFSGEPREAVENRFAGRGYGELKKAIVDVVLAALDPIQRAYDELTRDPGHLEKVLAAGAERASQVANRTLTDVRRCCGI